MGLFDMFKKKKEGLMYARMLNGTMPLFSQFGDNIYASDVVQQAVSCIVREMKKLNPQHVVETDSDFIPKNDRIQKVLENPNPLMTSSDFIEKVTWQLFFDYNSFILPTWDSNGNLDGLYPLQPKHVTFLEDKRQQYFVKLEFLNDYTITVKYSDLIHLRYNFSVNEFMGGNEFGEPDHSGLLKTLELNNVMLQGVSKAMKSSFAVNGIIRFNSILDIEKSEQAVNELTEKMKNNESGFMPMDMKSDFIPFNKQIAMVDEATLKFIDEKILRHFGVPLPILTGDYTLDQYNAFYQKTLEPLIMSFSQAFTKAIFSEKESFGFKHKIIFQAKKLIFLNTTQKLEMLRLLGDSGALYENEKRVIMGLTPLPELVGVRKQSLNYVDVEIANQYQTGKKEEEEKEPEEEPDEKEEKEPIKEEGKEDDEEEAESE